MLPLYNELSGCLIYALKHKLAFVSGENFDTKNQFLSWTSNKILLFHLIYMIKVYPRFLSFKISTNKVFIFFFIFSQPCVYHN